MQLSRDEPMTINARGRITISCVIYIATFS